MAVPHAVYPTLTEVLRQKWDEAEQSLYDELITEQGYKKLLKKIFEEAGLLRATEEMEMEKQNKKLKSLEFETVEKCNKEYKKLYKEIKRLKDLLTQRGIVYESNSAENTSTEHLIHKLVTAKTSVLNSSKTNEHLHGETAGIWNDTF